MDASVDPSPPRVDPSHGKNGDKEAPPRDLLSLLSALHLSRSRSPLIPLEQTLAIAASVLELRRRLAGAPRHR